ncbi:MAG: GNAT family N-acetyltransferase [Flavobacteriaceae bacterium]|nr:GNAT family N-acetyltransferase [Bacteroidia bacterium]NNF74806.1 GNAT family N-acetyltransferase [Flavobacteriaceae bacterium]NNK73927.1 GNAT family N-acetyltransferase [Flavobacteriaceae bacterium]
MVTLKGERIYLRALEPEDLDFVYAIENDEIIWEISNTQTPYSRFVLKEYLKNAYKDIHDVKQLRLVIATNKNEPVGLIDLFDFDSKNRRAGIGIVIKDEKNRGKGWGKEALQLLIAYSFNHLNLHQLYCNVGSDNKTSLKLFSSLKFETIGLKKDWNFSLGAFKDEYLMQLIDTDEH